MGMKNEKLIMKNGSTPVKKYFSLFTLLLSFTLYAQTGGLSTDQNYVYTKNCLNEDCSKKTEAVEYSDGLGRSKQVISIKGSPNGKDIVTPLEYDNFGRQVKSYLPIPQSGTQNGALYINPKSNASQFYGSDPYFYSESVLENSPVAKLLSSTKPGTDYHGHAVNYGYELNTTGEVKKYSITTSWLNGATENTVTLSGNHNAGELMKTSVTDQDGHKTTEFKNGKGQTVLVRKENTDTYYIYNKYGQLAVVIPPLAVSQAISSTLLNDLCYQYKYDSKGRQVEKKLPGKGWEYIVYDKQDRVLMTQDANTGASRQWLFTKYDKFGRTLYTGIFTSSQNYGSEGRQAEQTNANTTATAQNESRNPGGFDANGVTAYYTNAVYPTVFTKILSVNYYDTYPTGSPARPSQILSKNTIGDNMADAINTKNLPTASYVKNIEDDNWTKSYIWYDVKLRAIGTYAVNHLGGYTKTESSFDFSGVPQISKVYHKRLSSDTEKVITQTFEYDSQNRLKKQWHQVDAQPQELLAENTYNDLSQLTQKKVGNNLQTIDYTYNVRGSVIKVNDPASLGTDLFGYSLSYFDPADTSTGKYLGNIKEVNWKTSQDNILRKYTYQYDALNRLTKGTYSEPNSSVPENNFFNETAAYDLGGNITSLERNTKSISGTAELIDALTYAYSGNKLTSVTDISTNYKGYPDTSGNTISYDNNGNMKDQKDKGILQIDYNILDLPNYVKFDKTFVPRTNLGGNYNVNVQYIYRADGAKLKKTYTYGSVTNNAETATATEYLDGFQYEATSSTGKFTLGLKFVPTAEGYYNFEKNQYIYSYTDHLGNVRLSYFKNPSGSAEVLEENNFYPFGLKHEGYNVQAGNPAYNYGYNGKELQKETGWSDYGARMYMSDIGRWGVIDPLAETSRRFNPYNYAYNNPISFIDPDGRKALAVDEGWSWNVSTGSGWFNERRNFGSFEEFIKLTSSNEREKGSGGGSHTTIGDMMRGLGVNPSGNMDYYQAVLGVLSLRQQLIDAKLDPGSKAKFSDWEKIIKIGVIQDLISKLYKIGGYKSGDRGLIFKETTNKFFHGKSNGFDILIKTPNKDVLDYAFTIGHEIDHSITFYFRDTFFEAIHSNVNNGTARGAFDYFTEYVSYSWEASVGNPDIQDPLTYTYNKHGASNVPELFRHPKENIEKFKSNQNIIMKAYWKWYNNIK
jgi:RHS repeat-associated protein